MRSRGRQLGGARRAAYVQPSSEHVTDRVRRRKLRGADEQPMLWVLRAQLPELAQLGEGDSAEDENDDRALVCEARRAPHPKQVGAALEERPDRRLAHAAQLGHFLGAEGTLERVAHEGPVYLIRERVAPW